MNDSEQPRDRIAELEQRVVMLEKKITLLVGFAGEVTNLLREMREAVSGDPAAAPRMPDA